MTFLTQSGKVGDYFLHSSGRKVASMTLISTLFPSLFRKEGGLNDIDLYLISFTLQEGRWPQ